LSNLYGQTTHIAQQTVFPLVGAANFGGGGPIYISPELSGGACENLSSLDPCFILFP